MAKRGVVVAASWSLGVLVLVVLGAGCQTALPPPYVVEAESLAVYLVAEQAGTSSLREPDDQAEPTVPNTGGDTYDAQKAATYGLSNALARLQGQPNPAPVSFAGKVDKTRYLDLDEMVTGTVYVSNQLSATAPRALESGVFRVSLRVNGALAGGMDFPLAPGAAATVVKWVPIHYAFRPEVPVLAAGDSIALEVTQLSGLADLRIGTGGDHQSHARLQYYPFNPLGAATYLENHKIVIQAPDGNLSDGAFLALAERASAAGAFEAGPPGVYFLQLPPNDDPVGPAGVALSGLFLAPLAWASARGLANPGRRTILLVAILVVVALAGCSGKKSTLDDANSDLPADARPSVSTTVEEIGGSAKAGGTGVGEVTGVVRDWRNLTMEGAYVGLLGTDFFGTTDAAGRFGFTNVTVGKYVMLFNAEEMRSVQENVEVFANKRTVVTVKMAPLDPSTPDKFAHVHDEWGGKTALAIIDDVKFTPATHKFYFSGDAAPSEGAPLCVPWNTAGVDGRGTDDLCVWAIPIEINAKVPPGAGAIDITLDWTGTAVEMGVRAYLPATRPPIDAAFLPRGNGETTHVTFFPLEADPGHQTFTNWVFEVFVPISDPLTFGQQPVVDVGDVTVRAVAMRTVVPFEPGHPDLWAGASELTLFAGATALYNCTNCDWPSNSYIFTPEAGFFVPADAKLIQGSFKVSTGNAGETSLLQTFGLLYKPANIPAGRWAEGVKPVTLQGTFPSFTFSLEVPAAEGDQPYQTSSNFFFYPTSDSDYPYRGTITFTLDATVSK